MSSYLITGCSRGIGLALAKHLGKRPASEVGTIFATARSEKSEELKELVDSSNGRIVFVLLDATSQESVSDAAKKVESALGGKGLDVLINNAGIPSYTPDGIHTVTPDHLEHIFRGNVTSVHIVSNEFMPLLRKGSRKLIVNVSSTLGSMGYAKIFSATPNSAYKISKAALNMLTVQYALNYGKEGFTVIAISPGWLQTDLGTARADLPVETGVDATLKIIDNVDKDDNGKYLDIHVPGWEHYPGGDIPW